MANILSLALKISADASGLKLDPVERALQRLGEETDKVTSIFDRFAGTSEAAARAQEQTAQSLDQLIAARKEGALTAQEFAEGFEKIRDAATAEAAALQRAAQITEANITPLEKYDRAIAELDEQLQAGRISQETYTRATEQASKGLNDAERSARGLESATSGIDDNAAKTTLRFNELTGVFAALPGPIGDVAGRVSGLASAGEGLSRVFSGGLSQGFTNVASSVTALVNPFTLAVAGIAAFGAAANALINGLTALEDRVEKLGNTADKLGTSFEFVQVLDEAARRSGTSIDAVSAAFGRLQKSVTGVDEESKAAAAGLATIGITAKELQSLAPEDQYKLIGQRLSEIEDPAKRSATATQLFGKSGADLLPFFNNIEKAAGDIERFGAAISTVDRGRIDSLGDAFDDVFVSLQGLGQSILLPFTGLVDGVAKAFSGVVNVVTLVAQAIGTVLRPILDGIGQAFGLFGDAINATVGFFRGFFDATDEASQSVDKVGESAGQAAEKVEDLTKAFASSDKALDSAIAKASDFGQAGFDAAFKFQEALADLEEQARNGDLNAEQYARGVANATAEYEKQIDIAKQVAAENKRMADEAKRRADEEAKRVDALLGKKTQVDSLTRDIEAVQNQIRKAEADLLAARANNQQEEANALAKRIAALDQLQQELIDRTDEAAQGFADGFESAFTSVDAGLGGLIDKAGEFGNEGAIAASQLTEGIEAAKEAVKDGILNKEAFDAEVARQKQLYEDRVADLREAAKITEQLYEKESELLAKQFEIEKARAEELAAIRTGSIQISDIREGGISQFFNTLREDPALAEAKKSRQELEKIRKEIAALNAQKVDILAGTG